MGYNPLTGVYTPDAPPVMTPFGQAKSATKPATTTPAAAQVTPFGQAGSAKETKAKQQAAELGTPFGQTGSFVDTMGTPFGQAGSAAKPVVTPAVVTPVEELDKPPTSGRTLTSKKVNTDGSVTLTYSDGTEEVVGGITSLPKGQNKSAFDLITLELKNLGLESLIQPLANIFAEGIDDADSIRLALAGTDAYKTRFSANKDRINAGLRALSPAEYIKLEDQYQEVMRNYGLPASYYTKDATGKQVGFDKFIAGDVGPLELEDRIATAQKRVINANPEVSKALKQFYPDITNGDILAYTLDPTQGLEGIKRKVTAAEIGGAAIQSGLTAGLARAEELGKYGVDKAMATEGYASIGAGLQRGSELASIYQQDPYTQTTAESEIFKLSGQQEARKQRQKVTGLEKAAFGGQTGLTSGALARDRAGGY
jgi:hypothetical protein